MKNKNTIFSLVVSFAFVVGLVLLAAPKDRVLEGGKALVSGATAGTLLAEEIFFDFGKISMARGNVSYDFAVKNTTTEPIKISKVYTSCMCTTAVVMAASGETGPFGMPGHGFVPRADATIGAGEEFSVRVIFNPAAHGPAGVGRNDRSVYVETDSKEVLELKFTALVMP